MELQRADPVARRRALWTIVLAAAVGVTLLVVLDRSLPDLSAWVTEDPQSFSSRTKLVLLVYGAVAVLPMVAFALYFWSLGRRTVSARRFPPPEMKVFRDTSVLVGTAAETRGRVLKGLSVVISLLALGLAALLWRLWFLA